MFTLAFSLFFFILYAQPGVIWSTGATNNQGVSSFSTKLISIDLNGNIIALNHKSNGRQNIWLSKIAPDGELLWDVEFDGDAGLLDEGYDLTFDNNNNIIIHGITQTKDFVEDVYFGEYKPITLKFDPNGQLIWEAVIPVQEWFEAPIANSVIVDDNGNCYVTGQIRDTTGSNYAAYLTKYAGDGNKEWEVFEPNDSFTTIGLKLNFLGDSIRLRSHTYNSDLDEKYLNTITYDLDGNLLNKYSEETASWYSTVKMEEDIAGNFYFQSGKSVFKYNQFSELLWQYNEVPIDGNNSHIMDMKIDDESNVYLTGANEGMFTLKLDSNGDLLWKTYNPLSTSGRHMDVDDFGNTVVGCERYNFDSGIFSINLVKYDPDGNELASLIYSNARIHDLLVYDEMSFLTYIVDIGVPPYYKVQKYDLILSDDDESPEILHLFPNPANESITITWDDKDVHRGEISLYNLQGQSVFKQNTLISSGQTIDLPKLNTGIYYLKINSDSRIYQSKLIIEQ